MSLHVFGIHYYLKVFQMCNPSVVDVPHPVTSVGRSQRECVLLVTGLNTGVSIQDPGKCKHEVSKSSYLL